MNILIDKFKKYSVGNILFISIILIISLLHIFIWAKLSYVCALSSDNLAFGLLDSNERFFDSLITTYRPHGGGYTALFFTKFFSAQFSRILGLHVADTVGIPMGIIKGIFFSVLILLFTKYSLFFNKSKMMFISVYLFMSLFFYLLVYSIGAVWLIYNNNNYFRYLFPLIFYFIYFPFLFKYLVNSKMQSKYRHSLLFLIICNVFLGTNLEALSVQIISFYILLIVYNLFFKYVIKTDKKGILFSLNHIFYISFLSICTFFIMFMSLPGSRDVLEHRVTFNINFIQYIHNWLLVIFRDNFIYTIILFLSFICAFYIATKRSEINKILFILFTYLSLLLSLFLLVFSQKEGLLYLQCPRISCVFLLIYLYIIFQILSYILKHISNRKLFVSVVCTIIIILTVTSTFLLYLNIPVYNNISNSYLLEKKKNYIIEKMVRFFEISNGTSYIYNRYLNVTDEPYNIWMHPNIDIEACYFVSDIPTAHKYYIFVYNKVPDSKICFTDDAIEKFYNFGGYFTKQELNNISFQKLYNDDYIYNTPGVKYTADEVVEIMNRPIIK